MRALHKAALGPARTIVNVQGVIKEVGAGDQDGFDKDIQNTCKQERAQ